MINQYKEEIDSLKEMLKTLPRNNNKNNKLYKEKVDELLNSYKEYKDLILLELDSRYKRYIYSNENVNIANIDNELNNTYKLLPFINKYSSSYEKSNLDIILSNLLNFSTIVLEDVNNNILNVLNIFNTVGVSITSEDFKYSYYSSMYMNKFLSNINNNNINNLVLKEYFDSIYWKCPDIIKHIVLNFKHLYYKNIKYFDNYYLNKTKELNTSGIIDKYYSLYENKEKILSSSKSIILNKYLNKELDINNYAEDKVNKSLSNIAGDNKNINIDKDIRNLSYTIHEYKEYLYFKYIIDDIKKLYVDKLKYKNIVNKKKKEISKLEFKLFKSNIKSNKLLNKNKLDKFNYENSLINDNINKIKDLYDELETNIFLERIATLNDDNSLYDLLYLASSNYIYLNKLINKEEKGINDELDRLRRFIYFPYINIINNILINEDKNIPEIIRDKYNLFGLDLSKEEIEENNLDNLSKDIEVLLNSNSLKVIGLNVNKIKYIEKVKQIKENM